MLRDADIRDGLCDYLETRYGKIRFFEEFTMGKSRADIVLATEHGLYKYSDKSKMYRKKYLMESVDKELLKKQMLEVLFERDYSIFEED